MTTRAAVFLSYASQDVAAAESIADALRAAGVEVWFDKSELVGGDAWDTKIRQQIKDCTLFVPIISANTQARAEGYFRLEWKLAADRTHLMADDHPFLFPIVIDDTTDAAARVPDRFRERQWMRLDQATPAAVAQRLSEALKGDVNRAAPPEAAPTAPLPPDKPASARSTGNKVILYGAMIGGLIAAGYLFIRPLIWSELQSLETAEATPPVSEVERLLQQADTLVSAESMARADLTTAIELCQAAAEIEPLNPRVWAIWSRACNAQVFYRFDNSAENRSRAQDYAEKAMRLDPQSPAARLAQAQTWLTMMDYLSPGPDLFNQVMTTLRDLYQEDPTNPKVVLRFGNLLTFLPHSREEGLAMLTTLAEEQPEWAERAWNAIGWGHFFRHEFAAAQAAAARGLSDENYPPILMLNSILDAQWTGDLDAALEYLNRLPANTRWEDWMLAQRVRLLMWRGEPEKVLSFMAKFPRDWVDSQIFNGPKAWLTAEARRAMGLEIAANQDYIRALALVEERLKEDHQEPTLLSHRTQILHRLGRLDEARESYELQKEIGFVWLAEWALFEPELVFNEIETSFDSPDFWRTAASLRYLEWYAPVRETPEFQALLARADASPLHTPKPKQPFPADPQLAQAYDLVGSFEANTEDFLLAEDIVKAVLADRPLDTEAIITMAWVQQAFIFRGFDRSPERIALARRYAERAERLAPDNPYALLAYGVYQSTVVRDAARAETILRRATSLNPRHSMTQRFLDEAYWRQPRYSPEELVAMVEETAARFPDDALNHYAVARVYRNLGRPAEMEAALDRTLAIFPLTNAVIYKARLALVVRGDPVEMERLLNQVSDRMRNTERVVVTRFQHALFSRNYDAGIDSLQRFTSPWIEDHDYVGPKALLEAILLEADGRSELARQRALKAAEIFQRQSGLDLLGLTRNDGLIEPWINWHSGQEKTALKSLEAALQAVDRPYRPSPLRFPWDGVLAASLVMGQKETALELMLEAIAPPNFKGEDHPWVLQSGEAYGSKMRQTLASWLKLDPRLEKWRDDPDILSLLEIDDLSLNP